MRMESNTLVSINTFMEGLMVKLVERILGVQDMANTIKVIILDAKLWGSRTMTGRYFLKMWKS